jgi:hypothetical protein
MGIYWGACGMGFAMLTEDSFEHEGITYYAIHRKTCIDCAFEFTDPCTMNDDQPFCMASMRKDGEDVIWRRQNNHAW